MAENWRVTARDRRFALVVLAAAPVCYLLGFVFPFFQHPLTLVASPLIGAGLVLAFEARSRRKTLIAVGLLLLAAIPFLISPSYIGRLF